MTENISGATAARPFRATLGQRLARWAFMRMLRGLNGGRLTFVEGKELTVLGEGNPRGELDVRVTVHDAAFYPCALLEGSVGVGRSYMDGHWDCEDLASLIRVFARNRNTLTRWQRGAQRLLTPLRSVWLWKHRNSRDGARRNIQAHYDLGNEFFATFLDRSMMYSSAIYPHADATLDEAAEEKLRVICRKLELSPDDSVLEIGSGWGGFARMAAEEFGCTVTTVTISREQADHVRKLVLRRGLEDKVEVLLRDYRDLAEFEGRFDKLVSIEMIEAVGAEHLDTYAEVCGAMLQPRGRMLLQAIVIDDDVYPSAVRSVDFIKKYIFPGSFIPSRTVIADAFSRCSDLRRTHVEDLTAHYVRTLSDWHDRFVAERERVGELGFDRRFRRGWQFYFKYCEGGFAERRIGVEQILFSKPGDRFESARGEG